MNMIGEETHAMVCQGRISIEEDQLDGGNVLALDIEVVGISHR
jgi:hypothetical protein